MRKLVLIATGVALVGSLSACGKSGYDRARPDEFAVARAAPLVIPPDFALVPPQPGAPRPQDTAPSAQALDALFGGSQARSASENAALDAAGRTTADVGARSTAGSPTTNVVDKGQTTRDIVAAPEGDGQSARASTTAPAASTPQ
ncbi:hypothetical protein FHS95_003430 [Sphingomonas naasensis]|uniref:DUF3035 domain-containing protein n=1 Tax=Sphingomonas naasensis TaxID=1344951 RepID=A0A4S1WI52_9SPHN|nr:DUF3035 domain-containing protein [Sphingomonas naasensis]NIJ21727.1 hypothetical protein [Sphingomonas naasensis]TGX41350.1 DUF3035 domain-containing protein [Sphingomonas naasensis]